MAEWLTIEVSDADDLPASAWQRAHGNDLVEAAITSSAVYWEWQETRWGVVLELAFGDEERIESFRALPGVRAALDAVPDRLHGIVVYRGRGGGAGARVPRHPRPGPVAAGAEWPPPETEQHVRLELAEPDQAAASRRSLAAASTAGASTSAIRA